MASNMGRATTNLHLRKEPRKEAEGFDVIRVNQKVEILKEDGDWVMVRVDGHEGYLLSKFVVKDKEK